jgi:hypothetical protein
MQLLARLPSGVIVALSTLGTILVILFFWGGRMFSPGPLNAQGRDGIQRGGVTCHADLAGNCAACHVAPWSRDTMATRCLDCHTEVREQMDAHRPLHGTLTEGRQCRACHSEHNGAHAALTRLDRFDHNCTAFPLTGKHGSVDCNVCHVNGVFKGTPQTCLSCHAEPQVHKGRYGTRCAHCHSTSTWTGARFDHDRTAFPLTGKHRMVDCKSCHVAGVYQGTPQTCVSCHAEPKVHKGRFGTSCAECHSTSTWTGATFKHKFPLNHGRRGTIACATCHTTSGQYHIYSCYGCHQHQKAGVEKQHTRRGIGNVQNCVRCHPTGREHEARSGAK